jgi:hypothetical protein
MNNILTKAFRDKYTVLGVMYHPDDKMLQISLGLYTEFMLIELEQLIQESGEPIEWLCFFTPLSHLPRWQRRTTSS